MKNPFQTDWCRNFYSKNWGKIWLVQAILLVVVGFVVASSRMGTTVQDNAPPSESHAQHSEAASIWTCSMHPQIRRDSPGKCPICGMNLVPVKPSSGGMRTVSISPNARKLMRIETSPVERRYVTAEIRMVGKVEYDETRLAHITAWVAGRLDRLYVDYTGVEVRKGDHLVYIYSEELYTAQEELLQAIKNRRQSPPSTVIKPIDLAASAREKMRLLGLTAEQIREIEQRGTPADHVTIFSPVGGIVVEKMRQEGDRVRTGDRIYTVADLKHVWIKLDAYESDLQWLRYGQDVEFTTEAYSGETFTGRVAFIDPVLNKATRTVKVRVNVPNEDGRLKPEMFVRAVVRSQVATGGRVLDASLVGKWISPMHPEIVKDEPGECDICGMPLVRAEGLGYVTAEPNEDSKPLVIPVSSALVTGKRAIVYVEVPNAEKPTFEGREIVLGPRAGPYYLVRSGLKQGELVVTNGNFKLDSALQISAKPSMMTPEGGGGGGHDHGGHGGSKKEKNGSMTGSAVILPPQFKSELEHVLNAFASVTAALEEASLKKIRDAFKSLGDTLAKVDEKLLSEHPRMLWREFSMLLRNDVAEGVQVSNLQDADSVYLLLNRHIQRVRTGFALEHAHQQAQIVKLDVPESFLSELSPLWVAYQPIGKALAGDDLKAAKQAITKLQSVLSRVDASTLDANAAGAWEREQANLVKIVTGLNRATDIKGVRAAFALFSDEILALVKSFGLSNVGPVYEFHCPMAFKGRGASWLQSSDKTENPYYGAMMLKCADRIEQIAPTTSQESSHAAHAGHDH